MAKIFLVALMALGLGAVLTSWYVIAPNRSNAPASGWQHA